SAGVQRGRRGDHQWIRLHGKADHPGDQPSSLGPHHGHTRVAGCVRNDRAAARRDPHGTDSSSAQGNSHQRDRPENPRRTRQPGRSGRMTSQHGLTLRQGSAASRVLGFGSTQPEKVVTNDDLAEVMDTNDQWIQERVGIVERRFAAEDELLVDMAVRAGKNALADAGCAPTEIDTLILPNCTMPTQIPNAAAQVADRIGIAAPGAFDINAACAGFCYGLGLASDLIRSGSTGNALVIGAEKLTDSIDHTDRANAIIFADGAGAAVVGPSDEAGVGPVAWGSAGDMVDTIYMAEKRERQSGVAG